MKRGKINRRKNFFIENKRGLSDIVVTLIIIVLALVAVGIVWAVVSNLLKTGTSQANFQFGTLFLSLTINNVALDNSGNVLVTVSKEQGMGIYLQLILLFQMGQKVR